IYPTFEEYPNRLPKEKIVPFFAPADKQYRYTANDLITFYSKNKISALILINPDNPSGNFLDKTEVLTILKWAHASNITVILDESFIDFSDNLEENTFLTEHELISNGNLIIVKSISKSFGVPGVRLGFAATSDKDVIAHLRKDVT